MRFEIASASTFLMNLLRMGQTLDEQQLDLFRGRLEELLKKHYQHHWFPEQPCKGSGYRCIRINHKMDPLVARAAESIGVSDSSLLHHMFPNELTLWIDPREVSYRIGENGSICVLFDGAVSTTGSSSSSASSTANNNNNNHNHHHRASANNHHGGGGHHHQQHHHYHQASSSVDSPNNLSRYSTCKEVVRGLDNMIMDPRNMNFEQFATFVSS